MSDEQLGFMRCLSREVLEILAEAKSKKDVARIHPLIVTAIMDWDDNTDDWIKRFAQ
tara:strand:- start:2053 stop:2223 length:171 start_codon:yes stop_codon:yes gene_type:complete